MSRLSRLRTLQLLLVIVVACGTSLLIAALIEEWTMLAGTTAAWTLLGTGCLVPVSVSLRRRTQLRKAWAARKPKEPWCDKETVKQTRALFADHVDGHCLDDRTLGDIDLHLIHDRANGCVSLVGEECLYNVLGTIPRNPTVPEARLRIMAWFRQGEEDAQRVVATLHRLGREPWRSVAELLWLRLPEPDGNAPLYVIQAVLTVTLTIVAITGVTWALIPLVAAMVVNTFVYTRSSYAYMDLMPRLSQLVSILTAAARLASNEPLQSLAPHSLEEARRHLRGVSRLARFLASHDSHSSNPLTLVILYFKVFFLLDPILFPVLIRRMSAHLATLRDAYVFVGSVDALQAIQRYRDSFAVTCDVDLQSDSCRFVAESLYHPLLDHPVLNDISLSPPGILLTGANMAGKSTLLRSVVLNAVLAQSLGFAFARKLKTSRFRTWTLINKADSVEDGASFYLFEANRIKDILRHVEEDADTPHLIVVDEFFSGTNSTERVAAATAVLRYLAGLNCITVAATHDREIAAGLVKEYSLMYFDSTVGESGLVFDYALRPGMVESTNGIALLRALGYPEPIIGAAESFVSRDKDRTPPT